MSRSLPAVALVAAALAAAMGCFREPLPTRKAAEVETMPSTSALSSSGAKVRLAVVIVFDQLRGDYLERWRPQFGPDGFQRLMTDGAWFTDCHYPYATTTTGPGHAAILTGCSADRHGVINNNWYDRKTRKPVYCAGDPFKTTVPPPPKPPAYGGSPFRMAARTVADTLKDTTKGSGKVVGLSLKDRGAIFPTGSTPDAAYWFDDRLSTSTHYRDAVHPWVAAFNASGFAEKFYGKPWERSRPDLDYDKLAGPDDGPGEGTGIKQGNVFPHPMTGGLDAPGPDYYAAVESSPFGNDLLLEVAKRAVEGEQLGADDVPDLLTVSFSSNDIVGHAWGPDSHEVLDITLRTDVLMAEFLKFLDERVGRGRYSVVLTADHGICPIPEGSAKAGLDAGRVQPKPLIAGLEKHLQETFAPTAGPTLRFLEAESLPHLYLDQGLLRTRNLNPDAVADAAAAWLKTQPGIAATYTRAGLLGEPPAGDTLWPKVRKSWHPDNGGEVFVVHKPYWIFGGGKSASSGTTHGSPYEYDTHVPLLVYGPGVGGGKRPEPVTPQHTAPVTAAFLGVPPPDKCEYGLPKTLAGGK
ncbi:MAG: alkaline phosphatase family protein [Fimbriiglobus sp.]